MSQAVVSRHGGSFRDPAGFVFLHEGRLYRQINQAGQEDFERFIESGLYQDLVGQKLLVPHREVKKVTGLAEDDQRYKIIEPQLVPFNSYPYEWSFSQLKDAARLTLKVQNLALARGMILKDASAYNVQFIGCRPIFIDTLSFKIYKAGDPWDGYKQFCEHFIAPLALASYSSLETLEFLRLFLDGLPLDLATRLLPARARWRRGLASHLFLHAVSLRRYQSEGSKSPKTRQVSSLALQGLMASLERTIKKLPPPKAATQWSAYYENTNYSPKAFKDKQTTVAAFLDQISPRPKTVWDLGANDGPFSRLAAEIGAYTIAFDVDAQAVEQNYLKHRKDELGERILPLVQDLANPSPAVGWRHAERASLLQRAPADAVLALALIHHLAIGNNLPFDDIASFFKQLGRHLIIEFVPKEDSKVQFLLRSRNNIFTEYDQKHFETAFAKHFKRLQKRPVTDSRRVIYLYQAKV